VRISSTIKNDLFAYVNVKPEAPEGLELKYRGKPFVLNYKGMKTTLFGFDERVVGIMYLCKSFVLCRAVC
jgi:hypothetical protein